MLLNENDLVLLESRRFQVDQVPSIWHLSARELVQCEKRTFAQDQILQVFAVSETGIESEQIEPAEMEE